MNLIRVFGLWLLPALLLAGAARAADELPTFAAWQAACAKLPLNRVLGGRMPPKALLPLQTFAEFDRVLDAYFALDPTPDDALGSLGLERGSYLLAVGSIDPRKNLPALAEAYGRLSTAERSAMPLVIVGGGSAVFKTQAIRWPVGTVDAGFVTDEELRGLYSGSRAVVFASLAEGFGLPLVEAAAAGATALIISDIPVFRWICGDSATYVDPASIDSIANALAAAVTASPDDRPPMFDPSRFNWDDSAAIVAQFCESPEVNR